MSRAIRRFCCSICEPSPDMERAGFLKKYFETRAKHWNEHYTAPIANPGSEAAILRERKRIALGFLEDYGPREGRLLEVGCGTGSFALEAALRFQVEGVDLCPSMLELAEQNRRILGVGPSNPLFRVADVFANKGEAAAYDVVVALGVLELQDNPARALNRCARWLKPGGILILSVPNTIGFTKMLGAARLWRNLRTMVKPIAGELELHCYTPERIQRLLGMAGFIMMDYRRHGWPRSQECEELGWKGRFAAQIVTVSRTYRPEDTLP